jgi:hypothetical protein
MLACPLTHFCLQECDPIMSEYDSGVLHHEVALSGSRQSSCKSVVLVTFGGCHLLDCKSEKLVRGIVLTPREPRRGTLVERDAKGDKWSGHVKC